MLFVLPCRLVNKIGIRSGLRPSLNSALSACMECIAVSSSDVSVCVCLCVCVSVCACGTTELLVRPLIPIAGESFCSWCKECQRASRQRSSLKTHKDSSTEKMDRSRD